MSNKFLLLPILLPVVLGFLSYPIHFKTETKRRIFYSAVIGLNTALVWLLLFCCDSGSFTLLHFTATLNFTLRLDGLGKIFAALSATLWPVTLCYAFDYMKNEEHKNMFYTFFTVSFGVTVGIAFAANLLTLYLFYELLTLATTPLVMHGMDKKSVSAAKKYMAYSFGGAAFAFVAMAFLISVGRGDFSLGGSFADYLGERNVALVLYCFGFVGFGVKAAIFPLHSWLPTASVAPTPVTALLHAVAVVKAGAFAVIRLTYYIYGVDYLRGSFAQYIVMGLSLVTILFGSIMALKQTHFKRRLAYSTVSNLSYILFAASIMTTDGLTASLAHMLFHSLIKIGAFFAAGAVLHYAHREYVGQLEGIGRKMPVTFTCFTVFGLALTGIPPLNGFISKWYISLAALDSAKPLAVAGVAVLLVSALLTAIYMLSISVKVFFKRKSAKESGLSADGELSSVKEASGLMTVPMVLLAVCCLLTGIFAQPVMDLIMGVVLA